jgi:hypothetical protein
MVRTVDGKEFAPVDGRFTASDGEQLLPGWRTFVGVDNYQRIVDNEAIRGPFIRTFVWTVAFAFAVGAAHARPRARHGDDARARTAPRAKDLPRRC